MLEEVRLKLKYINNNNEYYPLCDNKKWEIRYNYTYIGIDKYSSFFKCKDKSILIDYLTKCYNECLNNFYLSKQIFKKILLKKEKKLLKCIDIQMLNY